MSIKEALQYCEEHPAYTIPTSEDAEMLDTEHESFWITDRLGDRCVIYYKKAQVYKRTHCSMLHNVVVIAV